MTAGRSMAGTFAPRLGVWRSPVRLRRSAWPIVLLGVMLLLCSPLFVDLVDHTGPKAKAGAISFAGHAPVSAPVPLEGEWRFTWRGGPPAQVPPGTVLPFHVPGQWGSLQKGGRELLPDQGVATFELEIRDLQPGLYRLWLPSVHGGTQLFVDGKLLGRNGRIAFDPREADSMARGFDIPVLADGRPVRIRLDLAVWDYRENGITQSPMFGGAVAMQRWTTVEWARQILFLAALFVLAANAFITYVFLPREKASLLGGVAFISAILASASTLHDNLTAVLLPSASFLTILAIQYEFAIIALGCFMGYVAALFPRDCYRWMIIGIETLIGIFLLMQTYAFLIGESLLASRFAQLWPALAGLSVVAMITTVVRAARNRRQGGVVMMIGITTFALGFIHNALVLGDIVPHSFGMGDNALPAGLLVLLFAQVILLAERWSVAVTQEEQANADLRELVEVNTAIASEVKLDRLLQRIVETASHVLRAERSTLMLHDPRAGELRSVVAQGLDDDAIRVPETAGLAGHAFTDGKLINVADAQKDPRFLVATDRATGFHTQSVLTMPIVTAEGRKLGVMQALNRREGGPFNALDEQRMAAFVAQTAIAIDNATLFAEVADQRNYNESILLSMASGLVTLEADWTVTKVNPAARRILDLPDAVVEGSNARALLANNRPLFRAISSVFHTGRSSLLTDFRVIAAGGEAVAVNLSIVPLRPAEGTEVRRGGVLLLFEDISNETRLRSTMARYMSEEVTEALLAEGGEALEGKVQQVSILFADVRGFTSMAEAAGARETVAMLNEYFTAMVDVILGHGGILDKYIGDAIMALFGAPFTQRQDAANAVLTANAMMRALGELNMRRAAAGRPRLQIGIGVSTGDVVLGNIGSERRMEYTVIGDSVNLASRIEGATKFYGTPVLFSEFTRSAVLAGGSGEGDPFAPLGPLREIDLVRVKGKDRAVRLYESLGWHPDPAALQPVLAHYEAGRAAFLAREFHDAVEAFDRVLAAWPEDRPAHIHRERALALLASPPAAGWDGAWTLASK